MKDWASYWDGMPSFDQKKVTPHHLLKVTKPCGAVINTRFADAESLRDFNSKIGLTITQDTKVLHIPATPWFANLIDQKLTEKTKSIWHPERSHWGGIRYKYESTLTKQPRYPVYIVSKGRAHNGLTTKSLNAMSVPHYIVVEAHELVQYQETCDAEILVLPQSYLDIYDTCDDVTDPNASKGPGAARNFCIDHSTDNGFNKHWVMDDNLDAFHYLTENEKYEVECPDTLCAAEDFTDRFTNVPLSGLNYYSFCKKTDKVPAFTINTRIYSCLLVDNHSGYRWRGRYNEDTDLSLRILKDGLCTIQFNAFLCGKVTTQRMRGGNSKEFYDDEGTLPKSQMIADLHPDVAEVVWRFNRWHHHVNYKVYTQQLIQKEEYPINQYGLTKVNRHRD